MRLLSVLLILFPSFMLGDSSVTSNEVTWTFDGDFVVGEFVTGGKYVVAPSGVTITAVSPAYDDGHNGMMVNPGRIGSGASQGWESRKGVYFNEAFNVALPYVASPGESLCKVISFPDGPNYNQAWAGDSIQAADSVVRAFEVLTVLSEAPPAGSFRPPFSGTAKPLWNISDLHLDRLPDLPATASFPVDLTYYERGLERPWLMNVHDWQSRFFHPLDNMRNYHEEIDAFLAQATVLLMSDAYSNELLYGYVQLSIDMYAILTAGGSGSGSSAFTRIPVLVGGHLLDDVDMLNLWVSGSPSTQGREGKLFYYWTAHESVTSSAIVPAGQTWTGATVFFRKQRGETEHEHLHPSEWGLVGNGGGKKQENYRLTIDSGVHVGLVLAAHLLSITEKVNHPAYIDYMDRWMSEEYDTLYKSVVEQYWGAQSSQAQSSGTSWINEMWNAHRNAVPASNATKRFSGNRGGRVLGGRRR